jgi:NAD(P)-dependent dehydrogenase (short-subunit alcohol dehydrogenase family)
VETLGGLNILVNNAAYLNSEQEVAQLAREYGRTS